ncbi:MAG: tetratricopeptide repeat protein [Chthoniobacterales bacterium]|nr:tetratricopeptide repeat protein [Chthoniobacterales bacterium]
MSVLSFPNVNRARKTFALALALLGAVALAQVLAALYLYTRQPAAEVLPLEKKAAVETSLFRYPKPKATPSAAPVKVPAVAGVPSATVRRAPAAPTGVADTLLNVAKGFRERGDTTNAIAKLQQATALDPGNAEILAELALTYESMQLLDRSNAVWRRLQSLGPAVGPLFALAELKLQVGVPTQNGVAANGSPSGSAEQAGDAAGIPDGSTFGISEVTLKNKNDPEAETRLLLRVGVKVQPDTPIDHTKVKIQVFFYDMVNNDQVVLTNAEVSYEWVTPGHDWVQTGTEVLDVTYLRPKHGDQAPGGAIDTPSADVPDSVEKARLAVRKPEKAAELLPTSEDGPRQYLGYIVRVYYKDQLQAVRADPTRLLNLFPPPFTAPPQ